MNTRLCYQWNQSKQGIIKIKVYSLKIYLLLGLRYPFDITTMSKYSALCIAQIIPLMWIVSSLVGTESFFMGICFHITACFKDLIDSFSEIDERITE